MTRTMTWAALCGMMALGCTVEAQPSGDLVWTGHQEAHPMRLADGSVRTMPDGSTIQLAGGTFTVTLSGTGTVAVERKLDDGRAFAYRGQCATVAEGWRCQADDGVGVPLVFEVQADADGRNATYRSLALDPSFPLTLVE